MVLQFEQTLLTVIWVVGIGKSSTALILYESFSTPFADTV